MYFCCFFSFSRILDFSWSFIESDAFQITHKGDAGGSFPRIAILPGCFATCMLADDAPTGARSLWARMVPAA
jgi:hypothetical protein